MTAVPRTRARARRIADRTANDADALWSAVRAQRDDGTSPIRDDEVMPLHELRKAARAVQDLLHRE